MRTKLWWGEGIISLSLFQLLCHEFEGKWKLCSVIIVFFFFAAAAAKSLQSCPTLCDPIDSSPPGSPILVILQARTLEWVAISFSNAWKWKVKVKSLRRVRLPATPWTTAYQAPPSMGFSRQEYWSGVPLPSPLLFWLPLNSFFGIYHFQKSRELKKVWKFFVLEKSLAMCLLLKKKKKSPHPFFLRHNLHVMKCTNLKWTVGRTFCLYISTCNDYPDQNKNMSVTLVVS